METIVRCTACGKTISMEYIAPHYSAGREHLVPPEINNWYRLTFRNDGFYGLCEDCFAKLGWDELSWKELSYFSDSEFESILKRLIGHTVILRHEYFGPIATGPLAEAGAGQLCIEASESNNHWARVLFNIADISDNTRRSNDEFPVIHIGPRG